MLPLAPNLNAYIVYFPEEFLSEIRASYYQELSGFLINPANQHLFRGGKSYRQGTNSGFYLYSYDTYPLLWLSNDNPEIYQIFERFYQKLDLQRLFQPLVDSDQTLVMYSGFLVLGNQAPEALWHYDYLEGANAYTLITPLFDLDPGHGQLLYLDANNTEQKYTYTMNEAIIFGDHFLHSTEPYTKQSTYRVLVSFTFGTDKTTYWPLIKKAVCAQSRYYCLPCGHMLPDCDCSYAARSKPILKRLSHFFHARSS